MFLWLHGFNTYICYPCELFIAGISTGSVSLYNRGGHLDEIWEPHLIEATQARAMSLLITSYMW
jgi:hypothetical protein